MSSGASALVNKGVPEESCFPYASGREGGLPSCKQSCTPNIYFKLKSYKSLSSASSIKEALQYGPVLASMSVYEDFMYYGGGVYEHVMGDFKGGHAIVIIGYDDSGVGDSGYRFILNPVDGYIAIKTPEHLNSLNGKVTIIAEGSEEASKYYLTKIQSTEILSSGDFINNKAIFNTTQLEDGRYLLWATSKTYTSQKIIISVVNTKPDITMKLSLVDGTDPVVKDRVYLRIKCEASRVPLDYLNLNFVSLDTSAKGSIKLEDPCPSVRAGWRTKMYVNGKYKVFAVGKVGNYTYESNSLELSVKN
jgi:hypothetical protein